MRKRMTCFLMTFILLISIIPMSVIPVSAASNRSTSEQAISLIKEFEGFSATAFWDVNQWTIGYGTTGYEGQTITEANADREMRKHLVEIDAKINEFADKFGLSFTQNQHDALASFTFNVGTRWMDQSGKFRQAVINRASGNEFLYAISLWANAGSVPDPGLLRRRLCEANIYFNGVYSKTVPSQYTYVILDPNGGTPGSGGEDKMQAYLTNSDAAIMAADPSKADRVFGGWFTEASGGQSVKKLNASTAQKTLYAQYGIKVTVTDEYANIRSAAGASNSQVGTAYKGDTPVIVQVTEVDNNKWGRFKDGWIALMYTNYADIVNTDDTLWGNSFEVENNVNPGAVVSAGIVSCDTYVNIRRAAGTDSAIVGKAVNGTKVEFTEITTVGNQRWGKTSIGWICMDYVRTTTNPDTNGNTNGNTYSTGTVTGNGVNVRVGAGTGYAVAATMSRGMKVNVYDQTVVNGTAWGKIGDNRWICMNYVQLDSNGSTNNNTASAYATGRVSSSTNLNVRYGAGTNFARVTFLTPGTAVTIYETKDVNGIKWGRIGDNRWVSMQYVQLDSNNSGSGSSSNSGSSSVPSAGGGTLWDNTDTGNSNSGNSGTATAVTGRVNSRTGLNVRSGAGTNYGKVKQLASGAAVTIYEEVTVGGVNWGRIGDNMWVCMSYITKDTSGNADNTRANGTVKSNIILNVRSGAGTAYGTVGSLNPGTRVEVLERKTVNGVQWGRISSGWICLAYVNMDSTSSGTSSSGTTTSTTTSGNANTLWGDTTAASGTTSSDSTSSNSSSQTNSSTSSDSSQKILEGPFPTAGAGGTSYIKSASYVTVYAGDSESSGVLGLIRPDTTVGIFAFHGGFTNIGNGMWVRSEYIAPTEIVV